MPGARWHECRYVVSWDRELAEAAADPEQRVTALEAQVVAMSQRLESAYATASDLVSRMTSIRPGAHRRARCGCCAGTGIRPYSSSGSCGRAAGV